MEKLLNDDERFVYLLLNKKHQKTCLEFIRLGYPVSAGIISELIKKSPGLLSRILDMDFSIYSAWDYYNDAPADDCSEIFTLLQEYYGSKRFFEIISRSSLLCVYFLDYFVEQEAEMVVSLLEQKLAAHDDAGLLYLLKNCDALQDIVRKRLTPEQKSCLYKIMTADSEISDLDFLAFFGFKFCLKQGRLTQAFLEEAFWDTDSSEFWAIIRDFPQALQTLRKTDDYRILIDMKRSRL